MKRVNIFFVGRTFIKNIEYYSRLGYSNLGLFLDINTNERVDIEGLEKIYKLDMSSKQTVFDSLDQYEFDEKPDVLVTTYENYVLPKAWIGQYFQMSTISEEAALMATDKFLMRQQFQQKFPEITPAFSLINNQEQLISFASNHGFPLILKPANLFKSLLITKNDNLEELLRNFRNTQQEIEEVYRKYEVKNRDERILVEEFLQGSSHSVEVMTDPQGQAYAVDEPADLIFGRDMGVNDNYNFSRILPSAKPDQGKNELIVAAKKAAKALNFTCSPGHVEIVMTENGAKVIEIGARFGGYRSRMYKLFGDVDIYRAEIMACQGLKPDMKSKKRDYCGVFEIFPDTEGLFVEIKGLNLIENLGSFHYASVKAKPGQKVGLSSQGYKMCAVVILTNHNQEQFFKDVDVIKKRVRVILEEEQE